jgi:hypothetical protein
MRVIFSTQPVPAANRLPGGEVAEGTAYFEAILYDPGERIVPEPPPGATTGRPVAEWRSGLQPGEALRVPPDASYVGVAEVQIPAAVLETLPATARLQLLWKWTRRER